eukprot:13153638-Ditylum_brightwellii.AAC.1
MSKQALHRIWRESEVKVLYQKVDKNADDLVVDKGTDVTDDTENDADADVSIVNKDAGAGGSFDDEDADADTNAESDTNASVAN